MWDELRHALRTLLRRPGTPAVAIVCLSLGLGASAALFSAVDALLFRPPAGVADAASLARVRIGALSGVGPMVGSAASWPQYEAVRRQETRVLQDLAAYAPRELMMGSGESGRALAGVIVTGNYFAVLGVQPHIGRFFAQDEDGAPGTGSVVVLSHAFWTRVLAGSRDVLGSTLRVNGVPLTVIGVTPRGFVGMDLGSPDVFLLTSIAASNRIAGAGIRTERTFWLQLVARLQPGLQPENAAAAQVYDRYATGLLPVSYSRLTAMFWADQRGANPIPLWVLSIAGAVMLLACATVANLLLGQATRRAREISVQRALGATRLRILRQLVLEHVFIGLAAGALALLLAWWSMSLIRMLPVPQLAQPFHVRTIAFTAALLLLTVLSFGLAPALWAVREDIAHLLNAGSARAAGGRFIVQRTLMAVQIAIAFVLLVSAALFLTSLRNVKAVDPGIAVDDLLTASLDLRGRAWGEAETADYWERALARVRALPGVEAASAGSMIPFLSFTRYSFNIRDGRPADEQPSSVLLNGVASEYPHTMGLRMVEGRAFDASAVAGGEPVALVSEALARAYWAGRSPVGSCLDFGESGQACTRVIGVVSDARYADARGEPSPVLYLPAAQAANLGGTVVSRSVGLSTRGTLFIRARADLDRLSGPIRSTLHALDPGLPFVKLEPLEARLRPQRIPWEVSSKLFLAFGCLAALLAAGGMYFVVAFLMQQRKRELGVRAALGATRRQLVRLVLGQCFAICSIGILAGIPVALVTARLFASQLVGVSTTDPVTFAGVAAALTAVALLASYVPGRKAAQIDPALTLRQE